MEIFEVSCLLCAEKLETLFLHLTIYMYVAPLSQDPPVQPITNCPFCNHQSFKRKSKCKQSWKRLIMFFHLHVHRKAKARSSRKWCPKYRNIFKRLHIHLRTRPYCNKSVEQIGPAEALDWATILTPFPNNACSDAKEIFTKAPVGECEQLTNVSSLMHHY